MSNSAIRTKATSREYTGNKVLPANPNRTYFFIVQTVGTGTIEFRDSGGANGGGLIPLTTGAHYAPYLAPTAEISIVSAGTYVIHEG